MLIYGVASRVARIFNGSVYFCLISHRFIDCTISAVLIASLKKTTTRYSKTRRNARISTHYQWEIPVSLGKSHLTVERFPAGEELVWHWSASFRFILPMSCVVGNRIAWYTLVASLMLCWACVYVRSFTFPILRLVLYFSFSAFIFFQNNYYYITEIDTLNFISTVFSMHGIWSSEAKKIFRSFLKYFLKVAQVGDHKKKVQFKYV